MSYPGGKNGEGTYQAIINEIPPHTRYIELFLGSGAILNNKRPALENYGIEANPAVIAAHDYMPFAYIKNMCAFEFMKRHQELFDKDTFVYADPPYPFDTRKSQRPIYGAYEFTDQQHVDLLQMLLSMPAAIAISTYDGSLYADALKGWRKLEFQSMTRQGPATEVLYMNYDAPTKLHDYNFLGSDFTDRQRIKRKIKRHVSRLLELPALERAAIINEILIIQ